MGKTITAAVTTAITADGFAAPRKLGGAALGRKLPAFGERTRLFMLGAHYSSWELVKTSKGWRLVPTLKRLVVKPGTNWTPAAPKNQMPDPSHLEAKAKSRWDMTVFTDMQEYLVEIDGDGAPGIFLKWERVRTYADGKFSIDMDHDGYDLWRASLVADKRVEGPRDDIVVDLRRRLTKAVGRATRTPHLAFAQEAKGEAEDRLEGLDEAVKALKGPAETPADREASTEGEGG